MVVVFDGMHIAMLKVLNAPVPAAVLRNQILRSLVSQMQPEFVDIRIVNGPGGLDSQMPKFVSEASIVCGDHRSVTFHNLNNRQANRPLDPLSARDMNSQQAGEQS
jgi:hypothetical protein